MAMAWEEVVVAAIDSSMGSVLAAALLLPGVVAQVHAETAPEKGEVALKLLEYKDWQPDLQRIKVISPSVYVLAPMGVHWSVEGSLVNDAISGASPRYHTAVSGASRLTEHRLAGDLKLTHYAPRDAWSASVAHSEENDYRSSSLAGDYRLSTEDNNRTWNAGLAFTDDSIGSSIDPTLNVHRRAWQLIGGVTQAATPVDLLQLNVESTLGNGYFSDPYKFPDKRPDKRDQYAALLRWNHYFESLNATLRSGWRYYRDSFGVRAETLDAAWVQPASEQVQITPSIRYTTQRAARFYYDPVYDPSLGTPYPPGYGTPSLRYYSPDQRLASFGALAAGLRFDVTLGDDLHVDLSYQRYAQRAAWRVGGSGSPGLQPFSAQSWQLGLARTF